MEKVCPDWNLDHLKKAYRQGYMAGIGERSKNINPFHDVVAEAWEAGWDDGFMDWKRKSSDFATEQKGSTLDS